VLELRSTATAGKAFGWLPNRDQELHDGAVPQGLQRRDPNKAPDASVTGHLRRGRM
jgi:hypothetical protein